MKAMRIVGDSLPSIIRGDTSLLEVLTKEDLLSQFYKETFGIKPYLTKVARVAAQISNRFPHINVLEIGKSSNFRRKCSLLMIILGAGAGEATQYMLDGMQSAFASYTFTDFWDSQFEEAQKTFQAHQSKMAYKVLDIEKDILEQGYSEESFDLVVASLALYATKNLEATLSNVRRLIKPGGYLILLELTDPNIMRFGIILGGLPAWWMGHSEGRTLSPCIKAEEWCDLMHKTGFSGSQMSISNPTGTPNPFSVILTQAVDQRIDFLHNPLLAQHNALEAESLTIVGGNSSLTTSLVLDIKQTVQRHYGKIKLYSSLADVALEDIPVLGSVLCLSELDEHTIVSMTPHKLKAFQELFKKSKNIFWVGYGAQGENPYGQMIAGVLRTLHVEMPHLRMQFMNFHALEDANPDIIAKKVLQLEASGIWEQKGRLQEILWYTEPELKLRDGKFFIPRMKLKTERNDRYNSSKRLIVKNLDRDSVVRIERSSGDFRVLKAEPSTLPFVGSQERVQITHSLLRAVKLSESGNLFLFAGNNCETGKHVVGLCPVLESCMEIPSSLMVQCGQSEADKLQSMIGLYTQLLVQSVVKDVLPGSCIGVVEPDFALASVFIKYASQMGVRVVLFTAKHRVCSHPWVQIHPKISQRELMRRIPSNIVSLLNADGKDCILSLLRKCLPAHCKFHTESSLTFEAPRSFSQNVIDESFVASQLRAAWGFIQLEKSPVNTNRLPVFNLEGLMESQPGQDTQALVNWGDKLSLQVLPATRVVTFSANKTYWLVGLTGGLGLSLCQWMAGQGARYIALSSRNPKLDEKWILEMAAMGCTVRVFAK